MEATAEMAGFFAAHAVWCVADGQPLTPLVAYHVEGEKPRLQRFVHETYETAVDEAREFLADNPKQALRAVLIFDGYVALGDEVKTDALLVEAQDYGVPGVDEGHSFLMAIPYRHAENKRGFAVHRPKFLEYEGPGDDPDFTAAGTAFFVGVDQHEEGGKVWKDSLDESI